MKLEISRQRIKKTFLIILSIFLFFSSIGFYKTSVSEAAAGSIINTVKAGSFQGITVDSIGNLYYVKATDAAKIYKLATNGVESVFAVLGSATYQLVIDANDNIYTASSSGLLKVTPSGAVSTITGPSNMGQNMSLAVDNAGNLYYSNSSLNSLYKVDSQGNVTTVATGFGEIMGMAVNSDGSVYVSEYTLQVIKKIDKDGNVTTFAGTSGTAGYTGDGGQASNAKLSGPHNLAIANGQLYIAEFTNYVVRKIDLASGSISTVAGTGSSGATGDGGAADAAKLGNVYSLSKDSFGALYIATTSGLRGVYTPGTLSGIVQDINNNPVNGATVTMVGGFTTTTATTDASGNFTFNNVFPGSQKLTVTASSFADGTATAEVRSGESSSVGTMQLRAYVTGVTLDQTALSLSAGGSTAALTAIVAPSNAGNKNVTWTSSNSSIAAVDGSGTVTPIAVGTATITATTVEGGFFTSCTVTVSRMLDAPTGLTAAPGDGQVTLHWSAVPGVVTYDVYKATTSGIYGSTAEATVSGAENSYTATGLANGTTYYFVVKGIYDEGMSASSNETSATPVSSNADLSSLVLSSDTLNPIFNKEQTSYTASVTYSTSSLTVTASVDELEASVKVNGVETANGSASAELPLNVGENTITVEVTAQDGVTQKIYTIVVTRLAEEVVPSTNADLSGLTLSSGTMNPVFTKAQTSYTASVAYSTSSLTVTASVDELEASVKVNGVETANGSASAELPLNVGENTITVEVTAQDGVTQKIYTIVVTRLSRNQPGNDQPSNDQPSNDQPSNDQPSNDQPSNDQPSNDQPSNDQPSNDQPSNNTPPALSNGVQVVVDGIVREQSATAKKDNIDGQTVTIITVDTDKVIANMDKDENHKLAISVGDNSEVVVGELDGKLVKAMEGGDVLIEIKTDRATYTLPASQINIDSIAAQLGSSVKLEDIKISIKLGLSLSTTAATIQKATADGKMLLVGSPIDFEVTATRDGKTVGVNQFQSYVERSIALPAGNDASQVTTAVVLNADGSLTHVPTKFVTTDGKTSAVINSLTNSSYALVLSPKIFADVENHWSKQDVNDMASRQVIRGVTDGVFQPDKAITRAEFVAIMVRALGLKSGVGTVVPKDIQVSDWYAGVVQTAVSYKLISGYEDGTFRPNLTITRKEASAIVARALTLTKLDNGMMEEEATRQLALFTDGVKVPVWAKNDLAVAIKNKIFQGDNGKILPDDNVTRAQAAAMLRRLLVQADLIN